MVKIIAIILSVVVVAQATLPCGKKVLQVDVCNKTKVVNGVKSQTFCSWETLIWQDNSVVGVCSTNNQIPSKNVPWKMVILEQFVYILVRSQTGSYNSLNRFHITDAVTNSKNTDGSVQCPALSCFPNCGVNQFFDKNTCASQLPVVIDAVDVYQDKCNRLWVFDTGCYYDGVQYVCPRRSSLAAFSEAGVLLERHELEAFNSFETWSAMIVNEEGLQCTGDQNGIYFYLLNARKSIVHTYSLKEKKYWEFKSYHFRPEPSQSAFEVSLPNTQFYTFIVNHGVENAIKGSHGIYFHCGAGKYLFHMPYSVLNNEEASKQNELTYGIEKITHFNAKGQSAGLVNDGVIFYFLQIQNAAVACVNGQELKEFQLISVDDKKFSSSCSIQLYQDNTVKKLFIFSNNRFDIERNGMNDKQSNFVISYIDTKDVEAAYPECKGHYTEIYKKDKISIENIAEREAIEQYQQLALEAARKQHSCTKCAENKPNNVDLPYLSPSNQALYQLLLTQLLVEQKKKHHAHSDCPKKQKYLVYGQ